MSNKLLIKLWVIKFCLKVIYPKYNLYFFLVFLAIKYRIRYRKAIKKLGNMESFVIKTISSSLQRYLLSEHLDENLPVLLHKCLIISRGHFIEMSSENLFFLDNGVLWVTLKLAPESVKFLKTKKNDNTKESARYNFNLLTSEINKKLWTGYENECSVENERIVAIVGSKLLCDNTILTTEDEYQNILLSFGLENFENVKLLFHPVPSLDCAPKIAATAELSLIVNDYDISDDFLKEILSNHFETPMLLSLNDVICVQLDPIITAKYHYKYLDLVESTEKLYFKCKKITTIETTKTNKKTYQNNIQQAFFIVKRVTQLSLGENIHSVKPKDEYFKLNFVKDDRLFFQKSCPTGLRQKFNQIQEAIHPFTSGDISSLSTSLSSPIMPLFLVTGCLGSGKHLLIKTLAKYNGLNCLQIDCNAVQSSTAKQTESKINTMVQKAKAAAPAVVLMDNFEVFAVDPENNEDCRVVEYFSNTMTDLYQNYTKHPIIIFAVTTKVDLIKPNLLRIFLERYHIPRLNNQQRYEMLHWMVTVMQINIDGEVTDQSVLQKALCDGDNVEPLSRPSREVLQRVAAKTETFLYGDIDTLMHFALRESYLKQCNSFSHLSPDPNLQFVQEDDFISALENIRSLHSQDLDTPKIPKVHWEDIGGLEKLKKELLKTIEFPIKYPHLFKNSSLKRSGILLYGPPGCGKTLVAKAVSTELNVSFLSVKGPELLNMYIGQSEENVRKVFECARASSPCVVFLDELDALAPRRGSAGDSGGASDRVVSQLLAELDGVTSGEDADMQNFVFIMGATNRPDLLEQSLLRPGRLDKLIYVGPYCGLAEKTCVLKALCRSYRLRPEVDLEQVSATLPERCTGADLLQVVSTARSAAVRTLVSKLNAGTVKESDLNPDSVILGVSDLWQGVESFRPSVTEEELAYYESLQSQM